MSSGSARSTAWWNSSNLLRSHPTVRQIDGYGTTVRSRGSHLHTNSLHRRLGAKTVIRALPADGGEVAGVPPVAGESVKRDIERIAEVRVG